MKKKPESPKSRREQILRILRYSPSCGLPCQEICRQIIVQNKLTGSVAHYLSASISSKLAKLVKDGILKYSRQKTSRGGHIYQLK